MKRKILMKFKDDLKKFKVWLPDFARGCQYI